MINIDENHRNADWPKRTPDHFATIQNIVRKGGPGSGRYPKGSGSSTMAVDGRVITVVKPKRARKDVLVKLNVAAFDAAFQRERDFYIGPGGTGNPIHDRYPKFGEFIAKVTEIEAAEVTVNDDGKVGFTNGRHRYAWLRDHGVKDIPVAMTPESVQNAAQHGMLMRADVEPSADFRQEEGTLTEEMRAEPLPVSLTAGEDRIRREPNEHLFVFRDGVAVAVLGNDNPKHVMLDAQAKETINFKDATITHNHPSGYGLSNQDGVAAAKRNLKEMRAVTKAGTHVITRTGDAWPWDFAQEMKEIDFDVKYEMGLRLKGEWSDHEGAITIQQANSQHHAEVYRRLQERVGGFTYSFEPKS
jgi:hypothetical protein